MFNDIPKDKTEEYKKIFKLYSTNDDGYINKSELATIFKSTNIDASDEEIKEIMKQLDLEEKNKINYDEFLSLINKGEKDSDEQDEIIKAFKVFDKDGNGLINIKELKDIMLSMGNNWDENELDEMLADADYDMDGYINYEEFVRAMMSK